MKKLKPCPFCGEKPKLIKSGIHYQKIMCVSGKHPLLDIIGTNTSLESAETLIEAWNTRTDYRPAGYWGKLENGKMLNCSVCLAKYRNSGICEVMRKGEGVFDYEEPRYCPHCGAKMEKDDE